MKQLKKKKLEEASSNAKNTEHLKRTCGSIYALFLKYKVKHRAPFIHVCFLYIKKTDAVDCTSNHMLKGRYRQFLEALCLTNPAKYRLNERSFSKRACAESHE